MDSLRNGGSIPDRTVALTFDDGYRSVYTEAFPRLRELGWPFTVFVCPDAVDHGPGTGHDLGSAAGDGRRRSDGRQPRSVPPHLQRRRDGETDRHGASRTRAELLEAQRRIDEEIGTAPALFAYPYGEYDDDLQGLIKELGWAAFGQQSGPMGWRQRSDPAAPFPMAGPFAAMEIFPEKVASLPLPVVDVRPGRPSCRWPGRKSPDRRCG